MKLPLLLFVSVSPFLVVACADTYGTAPTTTTSVAAPRPEAVQPSAEVRDGQQRLRALGMYDGAVDGLWGPETQAAVQRFQRSQGLAVTARLDDATSRAMHDAATVVQLSTPTDVRTVQNRLRQLNYYDGAADGVWGPGTQVAIERFQQARGLRVGEMTGATLTAMGLDPAAFTTRTAAGPEAGEPLAPDVVLGIQQRLRQLGFHDGGVDGVWGPTTQASLQRFQRSRGLEASGVLNPTTASALGLDPNNLSASIPPR